ncbi:MAG: MFS transporter [Alphaproteobacteria bacterium]|nr:MFS transporter [Alphaproteobacteria bacterium]
MSAKEVWWRGTAAIVVSGALILLLNFGVRGTFGLFQLPMVSDLKWSRETFAFALAIQNLLWGLGAPIAGALVDKFGTGRIVTGGTLLYAAGFYLTAETATPTQFVLGAGVLVGIGASATGMSVILAAVGRLVAERQRSLALGIISAGNSLGQFVMLPLGQAFIEAYGWSTAALLMAAITLLCIPLAAPLWNRDNSASQAGSAPEADFTLVQMLDHVRRQPSFQLLTTGFFVCGFHVAFIVVHMPAYLVGRGLSPGDAANAVAIIGLFNIIGAYAAGALGGRWPKRLLLSGIYATRAAVILALLVLPATPVVVYTISALIGLLWLSTVPLTSGLVAVMFGLRYLATLIGIVTLSHQLGAFVGVWLGGYLYDTTGSYDVVWWLGVALGIAAAIIHLPINERRLLPAAQPA